ncbi:MAG: hypothetical protein NC416_13415 [Eubacterium sp.]|nr:hypothetical protein [Eubacterium sp.]
MNWITGGIIPMSKVVTESTIKAWIHRGDIIESGDECCAEGIKYDFRLGSKFLKAYFGRVMDYGTDLQTAEDKRKAVVEPGEVVFVLSQERLNLPPNVYVQLSPKRSLSQDGIELMGGLTVDPGYEGYLVFGLRNVAGTPFNLAPGTKIVGANFFELFQDEVIETANKPVTIDDFPDKLLNLIEKYKPVNPQNLAEELNKLQEAFNVSQTRLGDNVKELKEKVDEMSQALVLESTKREQENYVLKDKFTAVENKLDYIERENIRNTEKLDAMRGKMDVIDETTKELNKNIISNNAVLGIKGKIWTGLGTFFVTVIAGLIVAYFQGWIFH